MRRLALAVLLPALLACNGSPTEPRAEAIAGGRWSGDGACLIVFADNAVPQTCTLTVGCGHGQFNRPSVRGDGTFDIDGTYGIVAGPARQDPLPPAHFSGKLTTTSLTLTVTPSGSLPPATYTLHMDGGLSCPTPCV